MESDLTIWTLKDIAAAFSVSSETIKRWAKDGKIPLPDIGEIEGKGKKRWVAKNVILFLRKRSGLLDNHMARAV